MAIGRRKILGLLTALGIGGLVAGCNAPAAEPTGTLASEPDRAPSPPTTPTTAPRPTPVATATPTPSRPKVVRIGMSREPDTIGGYPGGTYASALVQNLLFNVLVGVDDRMQPYADLAESIPTLDNGGARWVGEGANRQLQTTFKLRKGVTWSDGKPLTSRDVRFTWELMMNPSSGANTDLEVKYEKVETPDATTVVFTMMSESSARKAYARDRDTYADFGSQVGPVIDPLYVFGISGSWIYPEHVVGPLVDDQPRTSPKVADLFRSGKLAREPVGTGPYTLREWIPGSSLTFDARSDYFKGAPRIQTIVFTFAPSAQALVDQLRAGQLDVVTQDALDVSAAPALDGLPNVRAYYVRGAAWEHLDLNLDDPILKDGKVRKALYHGIDRDELVGAALYNKSAPIKSVVMDWSWAYNPDVPDYAYDPDRAIQLLEAAGWREGPDGIRVKGNVRLALKYVSTDWSVRTKVSALLKAQLRKIGVDLSIEHVPSKSLLQPQTGRLALRAFQLGEYAWVSSYDPGADARYFFGSASIPSKENRYRGGNYPGYRSATADRLLAEGLATLDRQERTRIYRELQEVIMSDLPTLPLFYLPNVCAASDRLVNFRPGIAAIGETWNAHEWDFD